MRDSEIVAAVHEERFTRKKYDASFPTNSIRYCLQESKISPSQVDYVVFYDKPFLKFERLIETYLAFAPSVLRQDIKQWFEMDTDSPYMLLVADVAKSKRKEMTKKENSLFGINKLNVPRSSIPAVTHVNYSARVHTVHEQTNPYYYKLIKRFKELTGCAVLVNTSFNVRGEPIVCSPEDAFRCFMGTELDLLVIGNSLLNKAEQLQSLASNYKMEYELD